jgi:hypothetical protein
MLKKSLVGLFAAALLACSAFAQDHPNFAGTWKLNLAKSNPGDYGPSARTDEITQDGSKFTDKVTSSTQMGDSNYTLAFTADGNKVKIAADSPQAQMGMLTLEDITASWDGASLVVASDGNFQGQMEIASKNTYTLSADGKTLTIASHVGTSMGDFDTVLVFDKQ